MPEKNKGLLPPSLAGQVRRSLSTVLKKDMPDEIPHLRSDEHATIEAWARELMEQSGPKKIGAEELEKFFNLANILGLLLGTHGFKIPNPDVDTPPIFSDIGADTGELPPGLLHERLLPRPLIYSGDASQIRMAKFFLAKVVIDNQPTTVLQELAKGENAPITRALINCGMSKDVCQAAEVFVELEKNQVLKTIPVHPLTKQIYFEQEGQSEVLLIPVASESMIAELHHQAVKKSIRWLPRKLCAVGGANPVNGGALCSDLGGAFQILEAAPPRRRDDSLQARLVRGQSVYTRYSIASTDVMTFVKEAALDEKIGNKKLRQEENARYEWFADLLTVPLRAADELVEAGVKSDGETSAIGTYLRRNRLHPADEQDARGAAVEVLEHVTSHHRSLHDHISDARIREFLIDKMTEELL